MEALAEYIRTLDDIKEMIISLNSVNRKSKWLKGRFGYGIF
jgi:hypothetical protein